jgi:hypothetical protein
MYTRMLFPLPQSRTKQSDRFIEVTDRGTFNRQDIDG